MRASHRSSRTKLSSFQDASCSREVLSRRSVPCPRGVPAWCKGEARTSMASAKRLVSSPILVDPTIDVILWRSMASGCEPAHGPLSHSALHSNPWSLIEFQPMRLVKFADTCRRAACMRASHRSPRTKLSSIPDTSYSRDVLTSKTCPGRVPAWCMGEARTSMASAKQLASSPILVDSTIDVILWRSMASGCEPAHGPVSHSALHSNPWSLIELQPMRTVKFADSCRRAACMRALHRSSRTKLSSIQDTSYSREVLTPKTRVPEESLHGARVRHAPLWQAPNDSHPHQYWWTQRSM
jgi:hypothetical protein